jgi:hypothetical protein
MTEQTLGDVSQRNPAAPEHASADVFDRMFRRGPSVAADGGERGVAAGREDEEDDQRMKDVDQTPPHEDASANRVWERGGEPTADDDDDESVDDE